MIDQKQQTATPPHFIPFGLSPSEWQDYREVVDMMAELMYAIAARAYEEAAEDVCFYCRCTTNEAERDSDGNWTHIDATGINAAGCAASAIHERRRALADSISTEGEK